MRVWKVTRLIKDRDDYNGVAQFLLSNARLVCDLFRYIASKSAFPAITMLDVSAFCAECRIIDSKLNTSTVDRAFISAATPNLEGPDNKQAFRDGTKAELLKLQPEAALTRFQFIEILVRIAGYKYLNQTYSKKGKTITVKTFTQAVKTLFQENIDLYYYEPSDQFRKEQLWENQVS